VGDYPVSGGRSRRQVARRMLADVKRLLYEKPRLRSAKLLSK
jgi:hypothetical protein